LPRLRPEKVQKVVLVLWDVKTTETSRIVRETTVGRGFGFVIYNKKNCVKKIAAQNNEN